LERGLQSRAVPADYLLATELMQTTSWNQEFLKRNGIYVPGTKKKEGRIK
jgi:hypothetical protein